MDAARWHRVQALFEAALEHEPEQREAFLDQQCPDDDDLRAEVRSLLDSSLEEDPLFDAPPLTVDAATEKAPPPDPQLGGRIGTYRLERVIARGGMGVVYQAVQDHPRRNVALKVMRQGIASQAVLRRFKYEALVMGKLQHPGIAQIYEAGAHEIDGGSVPFFAMEHVPDARDLLTHAAHQQLDVRQRLELFCRVCDAVHHGHLKGVIHRDLKPANILVDAAGNPKVIDFGIARLVEPDPELSRCETRAGQLLGTLQYMSPEQCGPQLQDMDMRTDVYSLGVVLYELLADVPPYDAATTDIFEAMRTIREQAPRPLSAVAPAVKGDLQTVVLKALEKDRDRRYQSVAELAGDIRSFLKGKPIQARPPTTLYYLRLFARRHRALFASTTIAAVALLVATGVSLWYAGQAREQALAAQRNAYTRNLAATQGALQRPDITDALARITEASDSGLGGGGAAWELRHLRHQLDASIDREPVDLGRIWKIAVNADGTRIAIVRLSTGPRRLRVCEVHYGRELPILGQCSDVATAEQGEADFYAVTFWRDKLAVGSGDGSLLLWEGDYTAAPVVHECLCPCGDALHDLAFRSDGAILAAACGDGTVVLWDTSAEMVMHRLAGHSREVSAVAFSADGNLLASGSHDRTIRIWNASDVKHPRLAAVLRGHRAKVRDLAFDPYGRLVSAALDKSLRLWDVAGSIADYEKRGDASPGIQVAALYGHREGVTGVAVDPLRMRLASSSLDNLVRLWVIQENSAIRDPISGVTYEVPDRREIAALVGHTEWVESVVFDPHGRWIASGGEDGRLRLWVPGPAPPVLILQGHSSSVEDVAFHPDDRWLASGGGGQLIIWDTHLGLPVEVLEDGLNRQALRFLPGGHGLISAAEDGTLELWELEKEAEPRLASHLVLDDHLRKRPAIALSRDGVTLAAGREDGTILLFDVSDPGAPAIRAIIPQSRRLNALVFLDDAGEWLVGGGESGWIHLWRTGHGDRTAVELQAGLPAVRCLALDVHRRYLAAGCVDGTIVIWDVEHGHRTGSKHVLTGHRDQINALAFLPDEPQRLASASDDHTIRIWDPQAGQELLVLWAHTGKVRNLAFDSSGSRLASCSSGGYGTDNIVKIWETAVEPATRVHRLAADADDESRRARRTEPSSAPPVPGLAP